MYTIQNDKLSISISPKGAEMHSIQDHTGKEWIWHADPDVWQWHAPMCFPMVGRMKEGKYTHNGETYHVPIHGFARDREFESIAQSPTSISLQLVSDEETRKLYPFDFELIITYTLNGNRLEKSHQVNNNSPETMFFELGGHDAFTLNRNLYHVAIPKTPTLQSYQQDEDGMVVPQKKFIPQTDGKIPLDFRPQDLDCYLFTNLPNRSLTILDKEDKPVMAMEFSDFPYLVLWSKCDDFYCVEPWSSLPDCTYVDSQLKNKIGVRSLRSGCGEKMTYTTEFFV